MNLSKRWDAISFFFLTPLNINNHKLVYGLMNLLLVDFWIYLELCDFGQQ